VVLQRSLVIGTILFSLVASAASLSADMARIETVNPVPQSAAIAKATPAAPPIEERPYKIRAFVSFNPLTRVDARGRDRLLEGWRNLARRLVGPVWDLQIASADGPASVFRIDELTPTEIKPLGDGVDKVWLIQGLVSEGELRLIGRELDVATGWLGSIHARTVPYTADVTRELFRLSEEIFAPFAEIGEPKGDMVPLRVQGSSLPQGQGVDVIAAPGSIFRPIRVFYKEDGSVLSVEKISFSYLRVEKREAAITSCSLIRGVRDPLTKRISRKNRLIALGIKPAPVPTRLRFVRLPDRSSAAGYVLAYRPVPVGPFRDLATTDRDGRVSIPPGFASGLVVVRLLAGKAEPMFDLPIMPGETDEIVTIPFDPKPHAIALETQLDALRDSIIDLVAVRSRLERRIKAREQGDDWPGVEGALAEFHKLPPRDGFTKRLEQLQDDAQRTEAKTKSIVLTKNARTQLADTKALIDRYLDDELFRAYEDAAARAKERDAKPKTKVATKPRVALTPIPESPTSQSNAQTARPAAAAPSTTGVVPF